MIKTKTKCCWYHGVIIVTALVIVLIVVIVIIIINNNNLLSPFDISWILLTYVRYRHLSCLHREK